MSCPTHAFQACRFGRSRTPPEPVRSYRRRSGGPEVCDGRTGVRAPEVVAAVETEEVARSQHRSGDPAAPGASAESCFLPDLTRFTGTRRAGPNKARAGQGRLPGRRYSVDAVASQPVPQVPPEHFWELSARITSPSRCATRSGKTAPVTRTCSPARAAPARPPPRASSPRRSTVSTSAPTASRAVSARTAWRWPAGRSSISSSSTPRRTTVSTRCATHPERAPRRRRHQPAQGLHHRRGAHALARRRRTRC